MRENIAAIVEQSPRMGVLYPSPAVAKYLIMLERTSFATTEDSDHSVVVAVLERSTLQDVRYQYQVIFRRRLAETGEGNSTTCTVLEY